MNKNDNIDLLVEDMTSDGNGVGKYEGIAVFIPGTAIGDKINAHIVKVKKNYAYAKVNYIIQPSKDRVISDCKIFGRCGGCVYRHINYNAECQIKYNKVKSAINRIGGVDVDPNPIVSGETIDGYRNKAQYPVGMGNNIGFYSVHSHCIVNCENCSLQPEIFNRIISACRDFIKENNIPEYNEEENSGLLRHIYIRIAPKTGQIMITFVINGNSMPYKDKLIGLLCNVCGENLKSIQLNINKSNTNVILGDKCIVIYGSEYITDILCGLKIRLSPLSFYQVNHDMTEKLYGIALKYANPKGKNIVDMYCGAGTIGLSMAAYAKNVIGVEVIPQAIEDAKYNALENNIHNAQFICSDASKAAEVLLDKGYKPDVVIVDPPRKGCDIKLLNTIADEFKPERIVYISCDPATLARDISVLKQKNYVLKEYTPVDLFPRTSHVETVVLMSKKGK